MAILSIGELLGIGPDELSGFVPYTAIGGSGNVISGINGSGLSGAGADTTAVSAIASAYAESAASGKLDNSASSTWYPYTGNPSGFLTSVDLSNYATTAYVDSSVSGKADASSLTAYQTVDGMSAFQPSGDYAFNSSLSAKQDVSAMSAYALSSDVSSVISVVESSSGSWGDYSGIDPVVVDNAQRTIGVSSMPLGVDSTMTSYMSGGATLFGVASSFLRFDGSNSTISSINGSALASTVSASVEKSASAVTIGSSNTAANWSIAQGYYNIANWTGYAFGSDNSASSRSMVVGTNSRASAASLAIGGNNLASSRSFTLGFRNTAFSETIAVGTDNYGSGNSLVFGEWNLAKSRSVVHGHSASAWNSTSFGEYNVASAYSVIFGQANSASSQAYILGNSISAKNATVVFGHYNLHGDGDTATDSAAFSIGDGTAYGARHDLMLVTKDGELRMYSSTADTSGLPLVATLRALSAWATANGWTGV